MGTEMHRSKIQAWARRAALLLPLALAACGGDDNDDRYGSIDPPLSCSVTDQKTWVGRYMSDYYYWSDYSPRPNPAAYASVGDYFDALLYQGTDPRWPADVWSGISTTASFNSFFGEGRTMGWGVAVAGNETRGDTTAPLYVRYIEPNSPAAGQVFRGDRVISVNGRSAAQVIANNFNDLVAGRAGDVMDLVVRDGSGQDFSVRLTAAEYALAPVPQHSIVLTAGNRKLGYVVVKDMINQVADPLDAAFRDFVAEGVTDLILDLRYNGGGYVSVGRTVASYVAGARGNGKAFAKLIYSPRQSQFDTTYGFSQPGAALGLARVFVLTGSRTCSASEQVINGLRGAGVQVVAIGDTTCGKPVGFNATDGGCGSTYSAVTFESVNHLNEGRYFDGFAATCPVAEDFTQPMGSGTDPLLVAAADYADTGACPAAARAQVQAVPKAMKRRLTDEAGGYQGMLAR